MTPGAHPVRAGSTPPTVVVNAVAARTGGGLTYLRELLPPLCGELEMAEVRTHLLVNASAAETLRPSLEGVNVTLHSPRWANTPGAVRTGFQQVALPVELHALRARAVLNVSDTIPILTRVPQVLVCRNMLLYDPRAKSDGRLRLLSKLAQASVARASTVLFVSSTLAEVVTSRIPVRAWRVVHHGPGLNVPYRARHDWPLPIRAIVVGALADYKRVEIAIEAVAELKLLGYAASLDIVGPAVEPTYAGSLVTMVDRLALGDEIHFLGNAGPLEVVRAYDDATVALIPSASESFCHPILEAFSNGMPVIAARDLPVATEIGGEAVATCPPTGAAFAAAIVALFSDAQSYEAQVRNGLAQASQFSWKTAATATAGALLPYTNVT